MLYAAYPLAVNYIMAIFLPFPFLNFTSAYYRTVQKNAIARQVLLLDDTKTIEGNIGYFSKYGGLFFFIYLVVDIIFFLIINIVAYRGLCRRKMIHGDSGPPNGIQADPFVSKEERRVNKMFR